MSIQSQSEPARNSQLRQLMDAAFNLDELHTLCFDLGYDFDKFGGESQGKTAVIRKIIEYADSQNQLEKLVTACATAVPDRPWPTSPQPDQPCPYRGLFAFQEEDQRLFFGREAFTEMLADFVLARPLTAVIGPSGSGKSSVVFAGLVPALRQVGEWLVLKFRPGERPFHALAAVLLPHLDPTLSKVDQLAESKKLAERLQAGDLTLDDLIPTILDQQPANTRLLLIADQFEELFTLCPDAETRHRFLDLLLIETASEGNLANRPYNRHFVLTLRADFMGQALAYPPLVAALQNNDVKLGPMTPDELRRAIVEPARRANVQFEEGLVDRILDDVGTDGRNLPLLEFALTELWQQQSSHRLTHAAYERIGQVRGALARHADTVYHNLTTEERAQAERIFVQLVHPGAGAEDTRRLATKAELGEVNWALVQKLAGGSTRLLVTDRDETTHEHTEVIHEALIQRWQRLRGWMDSHRDFRAWQERLRADLQEWSANDKEEGYLLQGAPLSIAQEWLAKQADEISEAEIFFIQASTNRQVQEAAEKEAQRQRELDYARQLAEEQTQRAAADAKAAIRARNFNIALIVILVLVVSGAIALINSAQLREAAAQAESAAIAAEIAARETAVAADAIALNSTTAALEAATMMALATSEVAANQTLVAEQAIFENQGEAAAQAATATAQFATVAAQATELAVEVLLDKTPDTALSNQPTPTIDPAELLANAQLLSIFREQDNMRMLFVSGGQFQMGDIDAPEEADNGPPHLVVVNNFYLDQFEVSVQQYADFLNRQGGNSEACNGVDCAVTAVSTTFSNLVSNLGVFEARPGTARFPVTWITWEGAVAYCTVVNGRLPTEAEWEYAARGVDGRLYPWGNTEPVVNDTAVFGYTGLQANSFDRAFVRVDALPNGASPFGVYGMAGGAAEWVLDWYDPDFYSQPLPEIGYNDVDSGLKVLRGGSWIDTAIDISTTSRMALSPTNSDLLDLENSHWGAGFRCARDPVTIP